MHLRKNELTHGALMPDADSHALTYATAAKKKMVSGLRKIELHN
jgi:hypothetical protein